jgi:hypothetical protein
MIGWIIAFVFGSVGTAVIWSGLYASSYVTTKECSWCGDPIAIGTRLELTNQGGLSHGCCKRCAHIYFDDAISALEVDQLVHSRTESIPTIAHTHSHGG